MNCPKCGKEMVPTHGDYCFCPTCREDCGCPPESIIISANLRSYYGMKTYKPTGVISKNKTKKINGGIYTNWQVSEIIGCSLYLLNQARKELGIPASTDKKKRYNDKDVEIFRKHIENRKYKEKTEKYNDWSIQRKIINDE